MITDETRGKKNEPNAFKQTKSCDLWNPTQNPWIKQQKIDNFAKTGEIYRRGMEARGSQIGYQN